MKIRNSGKLLSAVLVLGLALAGCNSDRAGGVTPNVTLSTVVTGNGSITADKGEINCSESGGSCSATLPLGTVVTLTATPADAFNRLRTWAGSCTGSNAPTCTVTLSDSKQVVAVFEPTTAPPVADIVALTGAAPQHLISFDDAAPSTILTDVAISGLQTGDALVGIDFRPASGTLYGVAKGTSKDRLYLIDERSGIATVIADLEKDSADSSNPFSRLSGDNFGVDFNPTADRLRIVSNTRQNLRVNPDTGKVFTDPDLAATANVTGAAYTFSFLGATTTTLFDIDTGSDMLVTQDPTTGALTNVGGLTVDASDVNGFDIVGTNVRAFAALAVGGTTNLYSINLTNGTATLINPIGSGGAIRGLAMPIAATPPSVGDTVVLTATNKLVSFNLVTPASERTQVQVTGLAADENLIGVDYRPGTGELYGLSDDSKLYTINPSTGAATFRGTLEPTLDSNATGFAVDFDPTTAVAPNTPERLRVVADTGQNLFVDVASGQAAIQTAVPTRYQVTAGAYTNSFKGARSSTLYVLAKDTSATSNPDRLYTQDPAGGTLVEVGPLTVANSTINGFDIDSRTGLAVAALNVGGTPQLHTVDLATGQASAALPFAVTEQVQGLALRTPAEPEVFAVCANAAASICTAGRTLIRFAASTPQVYTKIGDISDMADNEVVLGLDFRPQTGDLVALGSTGKLYTVNTTTGKATSLSTLMQAANDDDPFQSLDPAFLYGVDFNPVLDKVRIVGANNVNLRVTPDTGETFTDGTLQRTPSQITALAYANNNSGATSTTLYGIDTENDRLFTVENNTQSQGNSIKSILPGGLGVDVSDTGLSGFEVVSGAGTAYAAFSDGTNSRLYTINLGTGLARQVGNTTIGAGSGLGEVADITAPIGQTTPEIFAVTAGTSPRLASFTQADPSTLTSNRAIQPLTVPGSERALGLDFRPSNGSLYLLTIDGANTPIARLYTVNITTGDATLVGALAADPLDTSPPAYTRLNGTSFGMDFDPVSGFLRITSDTDQNLTVNLSLAGVLVTTNADLAHTPAPVVHAAAYTQNFSGAGSTRLLVWDTAGVDNSNNNNDKLMEQTPIDKGYLNDVGNTGVNSNTGNPVGLDIIGGHDGLSLAAVMAGSNAFSTLYSVAIGTGTAQSIGTVGQLDPGALPTPNDDVDTRVVVRSIAVRFPPQ